jgi:hypothetical protein
MNPHDQSWQSSFGKAMNALDAPRWMQMVWIGSLLI